jgi:putative membrane protein
MALLIRIVINAFAVWVAVGIVSGLEMSGSIWQLLLIALILGVINAFVKPIMKLLSIPLIIMTLGLFLLVINTIVFGIVIWLAAPERLDLGLASSGFWATFFGAVVISLVGAIVSRVVPD